MKFAHVNTQHGFRDKVFEVSRWAKQNEVQLVAVSESGYARNVAPQTTGARQCVICMCGSTFFVRCVCMFVCVSVYVSVCESVSVCVCDMYVWNHFLCKVCVCLSVCVCACL